MGLTLDIKGACVEKYFVNKISLIQKFNGHRPGSVFPVAAPRCLACESRSTAANFAFVKE
jgi:hypothetical protein